MTSPHVYVPEPVHPAGVELLEANAEVSLGYGCHPRTYPEVAGTIDAILTRTGLIDADLLASTPNLKVIARHGIGVDNIDVDAATANGVYVVNTPNANTRSVVEHTFALILAVARRLREADAAVRDGRFNERDALQGFELAGTTLGIVGLGRIGRDVAHAASAGFGMRVIGYDLLEASGELGDGITVATSLDELLAQAKVLTLHVPLTPQTTGLIGAAELDALPTGAIVVNAARGGVVDESALAERLDNGHLAGAGVDVFAAEPPENSPLANHDRCVLSPHVAAHTTEAMRRMAVDAAKGILEVLAGGSDANVLNAEALATASRR